MRTGAESPDTLTQHSTKKSGCHEMSSNVCKAYGKQVPRRVVTFLYFQEGLCNHRNIHVELIMVFKCRYFSFGITSSCELMFMISSSF